MGYRVLLIAVSGKTPEAVHRDFGVIPSGRFEESAESAVTGAAAPLPGGAYLLYVNDEIEPEPAVFARLSKGGSLLTCHVNETVMYSQVSSWVDGGLQWSVTHDAQQGPQHLETTGPLPPEYPPIRDRLLAQPQDQADYVFDIPVDLFAALGGLRHDQDIPGAGPEPWQVLDRVPASPGDRRNPLGMSCLPLALVLLISLTSVLMAAFLHFSWR